MGSSHSYLKEAVLSETICEHCGSKFGIGTACPDCTWPEICPNVTVAQNPMQVAALEARYHDARERLAKAGLEALGDAFEEALSKSLAIICCTIGDLQDILRIGFKETPYRLGRKRFPIQQPPNDTDWETIREHADLMLFTSKFWKSYHFGALSLEERGLPSYGAVTIVCKEKMIDRRATTFEMNSCKFMLVHKINPLIDVIPDGVRSTWRDRGKLCLAKLVAELVGVPNEKSAFQAILLKAGKNTADDDFVEVHIFDQLSVRALERVYIAHSKSDPPEKRIVVESLANEVAKYVECRVRPE